MTPHLDDEDIKATSFDEIQHMAERVCDWADLNLTMYEASDIWEYSKGAEQIFNAAKKLRDMLNGKFPDDIDERLLLAKRFVDLPAYSPAEMQCNTYQHGDPEQNNTPNVRLMLVNEERRQMLIDALCGR